MKKRNLYTALQPMLAEALLPMMACALLTACTNETLPPADGTDPGSPTTLTATLADDTDTGNAPDTRLSHENDGSTTTPGVIVKWTVGDAFKLYPARDQSNGMEYEIKNAGDITGEGKTAIFTATTSTGSITGEAKAIYPAAAALQTDGKTPATSWGGIILSMDGQTQNGNDNYAHTPAYDYMAANVADASSLPTGNDLAFHHLAAMMTVKITGQPDGYTPVTSPDAADNSPVQLTLSADGSGAGFYRMMNANGIVMSGSASLRLENITWGDGGFTAHLMIFPTDLTKLTIAQTFTISVLCKDGTTYRYTTPQVGKKYVAGMRYTATIPGGSDWKKAESGAATERLNKNTYASGAFYLGNGSSSSPYLISSAAELKLMQERVNNGNQAYEYYRLTTDIMIADDVTWEPIGISSHVFNGNFDGGGHTISGTLSGNKNVFGFFGYVTDGHIRNLRIAATVRNSYEDGAGCSTGGLVGYPQRVTISGCSYKGTVIGGKSTNDASNTGGLIGQSKTITLSGCTVEAGSKVQGGSAGSIGSYTGGLVGYAIVGSRLESCTNYAEIAGATDYISYVGGVAGHVSGNSKSPTSIHNCRNHGKVGIEGGANKDCYAGGLIGTVQDYTTLSNSRNTGDVTGGKTSGYYSYTGGLVANLSGNNEIIGCTNEGTVTGGTAKMYCYTGGLVGYNRGTLHTSHNTAKAAVTAGQLTGSSTNNENFTGGLVGGNTMDGKVYSCCTNEATVDGSPASSTAGSDNRIGGGNNTTVTDCQEGHIP